MSIVHFQYHQEGQKAGKVRRKRQEIEKERWMKKRTRMVLEKHVEANGMNERMSERASKQTIEWQRRRMENSFILRNTQPKKNLKDFYFVRHVYMNERSTIAHENEKGKSFSSGIICAVSFFRAARQAQHAVIASINIFNSA